MSGGASLVLDDEDAVRSVLLRALRRAGFTVSPATTLHEALAALAEHAFHTTITDLHLRGETTPAARVAALRAAAPDAKMR